MSLMSALYVGASGLVTSQNSLNTTAHNIANTDTAGYTRQQVAQSDIQYNVIKNNMDSVSKQQLGLGVAYTSTRQVRDVFLDQTYRQESGRSAFYDVSYDALLQIENVLGESSNNTYKDTINNLWTSVQELAKNPEDAVNQGLFVQRCNQFLEQSNMVYDEINSYQKNLNEQIKNNVETINKYGQQIKELNDAIRKIESGKVENANDLKDQRNLLVDKLAELANITYDSDVFGNTTIQIEGVQFVSSETVNPIGLYRDGSGFYTPYWEMMAGTLLDADGNEIPDLSNSKVVNTDRTISSEYNTDLGKLESLLYARGDHVANYTDLAEDKYGHIENSILMNVQAEFDQLFHAIVTTVNDTLADASDPALGYLTNPDGSPIQMFELIGHDAYTYDAGTDTWTKNPENPENTATLFSVGNVLINSDLMKQPTLLGFVKPDGSSDYETAKKLVEAFDEEAYILNPNLQTKAKFSDYYINLVTQVANSGSVYKNLSEAQQKTVDSTESARQAVLGVSSDEELSFMIKFQNAYNANSRYINAVNELLDTLVNGLV
ncbi:MAG: flagellar hook-associated protein FlgK [Lachnospiraceae bacterium]|nr:flagellar hook-associated protein FlgK [Candidatus Merdinaster equi]